MSLMDTNGSDIFSNQEQIYEFYETLRNSSSDSVDQFQAILEVFVCDVLKYRKEIKRLEDSYKREKETNDKFLQDIEAEQERDMRQLEEKIRQEEREKFEIERALLQQNTSKEINELQSKLQRLKTIEQLHNNRKTDEDSSTVLLREEIGKLIEENQTLRSNLNNSLTENAILQTELLTFRTKLNERHTELLQEKQSSSSNHRDKESLQTNVRQLIEVNKQLRDENDSLRAIIESNQSNNNYMNPPHVLLSPKRLVSTAGSTLGAYWNDQKLDSPSPSYVNNANFQRFGSFDLESNDEKGIFNSGLRPHNNLSVNVPSNKVLSSTTPIILSNIPSENNNTNDSGLSITTVRDMTEAETDAETRINKQLATLENIKQNRILAAQKNNDETDSDDVFPKVPLDRTAPKRTSRRGMKRGGSIQQSSKASPLLTRSSTMQRTDGSTMVDLQQGFAFDHMFKVVFCGDAAVGKSTLIMRLCKGKFVSSAQSTLGVDYQNKQIDVDGKRVALQLWDTAGQERFRSVTKSFFRRCDGVILVYDATYENSFLNVREWIHLITDSTSKKVSVVIVANKIDLRDGARKEGKRVIETNEGARLAKEHNALFIETSAKDGTNSNETLIELTRDMQCNEDLERINPQAVDLKKTTKKAGCCGD